ncbi:MAG: hypothetical protein QG629_744, partial [Patescibacteria group bacterium]|nr:hypothetical protein [Patescibacteria group bacterium]
SENGKGGGWWGASAHGGQAARLTHSSAETGFAQKCKIAPYKNPAFGWVFIWPMTEGLVSHVKTAKQD